jgi:hypothetical protein
MKSTIAIAALIGVAFATSSAFAQSGPGSTLPKPKVAVVPPPPPPGGPDKLVTRTPPTIPGVRKPKSPGVVDDLAAVPHHSKSQGGSTCGAEESTGVANPACVESLDAMCGTKDHPGGMRTNDDGSVTCVPPG